MDVLVVSEERLERTPDGVVWGPSSYRFWSRYLEAFDNVRIVARVRDVEFRTSGQNTRATGPHVMVCPVPYYLGPLAYLKVSRQVRGAVRNAYKIGDAVIMRVGCHIAYPLYKVLRRLGAPTALRSSAIRTTSLHPEWWRTPCGRSFAGGSRVNSSNTVPTRQRRHT